MLKKKFTELGLSPELLKAIAKVGYEEASPIQSEAIPVLLGGADIVGQSQTGSGKTAAFAIPVIERVDAAQRAPQALILCPTRELALQVAGEVARLAFFKPGVRELALYGGQPYERQFRALAQGPQILIGTPGRIMDHLQRGTLRLNALRMVVLDEADRMLDMGFVDDIKTILAQAPAERQTILFSATVPPPIRQIIETFTRRPVNVRIEAPALTVASVEQAYYEVERREKVEALCRIIDLEGIRYGLVFCATKAMVDELVGQLSARGYAADKLHGDMTQAMRERVMARFRKRGLEFLVATDVAARGVDVDDLEAVFNYDLPQDAEDYVHRIGRTGRAGRTGKAFTLVSGRETWKLRQIVRFTGGRIQRGSVPSRDQVEEKRAGRFYETLRTTLEAGEYPRHDALIDRLLGQGHSPADIASALIHLGGGDKPRPRTEAAAPAPAPEPNWVEREAGPERPSRAAAKSHGPRTNAPVRKPYERGKRGEKGMSRLVFNAGRDHGISPGDIVGVIAGLAKVARESIGAIRMMAKESFVEVAREDAPSVLEKLGGVKFKGRKLFVAPASGLAALPRTLSPV